MATIADLTGADLGHLRRAVELAREAFDAGDDPFGSVLVGPAGEVLREDRNTTGGGDQTRHPEFEVARWAAEHVAPEARAGCTVYTSGEHCAMCSAAHAWVGLGRIVFAGSSTQLAEWRAGWGLPPGPVTVLPIQAVAPGIAVVGPIEEWTDELREMHHRAARRKLST